MPLMITTPTGEKGFTLIEALVTILILSTGIFGILAVIIVSLQLNSSSVYRTIASQQAYAIAEVLRANPTTAGTSDVAVAVAFSAPGAAVVTASCLTGAGCSRNAFIPTSLKMWQDQLASLLPQGQGTICQDSTPSDGTPADWQCDGAAQAPYVVKVCWNESRIAASGGVLCTYTNL